MSEIHFNYINIKNSGYKVNITNIGSNVYDPTSYWIKENFNDVEITRPNVPTDLSLLDKKTLMTVNGYIYPTVFANDKLYIPNATKSMLKSRANHIGMISFNLLENDLIKHTLTPEMITPDSIYGLYDKCIITFNDPITTPMLIINGYMQLEEPGIFYRISDRSFALSLSRINYIERLYELQRYRDIFKELEIPVSNSNPSMIDATIARSDAIILKYLTTFNTFMVDILTDNLSYNRVYLEHSNLPGTFKTEIEPRFPLVVGYGKFAEYQVTKGPENRFIINTLDSYYNCHLLSKLNIGDVKVFNDHREVGSTYKLSNAFMLDLYSNV